MSSAERDCPNCSASVPGADRFCPACGFGLPPVSHVRQNASRPQKDPTHAPVPKQNRAQTTGRPITGEARNVQLRSQTGGGGLSIDILTFLVERFDEAGDRLTPIPVEVRGTVEGVLNEGDRVQIDASWRAGQTLEPEKFLNLTTGGSVQLRRTGAATAGCIVLWVIAAVGLVLGFIGLFIYLNSTNKPPF